MCIAAPLLSVCDSRDGFSISSVFWDCRQNADKGTFLSVFELGGHAWYLSTVYVL